MGPRRGRGRRGRAGEDDGGAAMEDDGNIAGSAPLSSTNGSTAAAQMRMPKVGAAAVLYQSNSIHSSRCEEDSSAAKGRTCGWRCPASSGAAMAVLPPHY